jgi:hypothetical protein
MRIISNRMAQADKLCNDFINVLQALMPALRAMHVQCNFPYSQSFISLDFRNVHGLAIRYSGNLFNPFRSSVGLRR